jgi:hypothetical protein
MTVINGIVIDRVRDSSFVRNPVREAIANNDPIEDVLHVVAVISNPCLFAKRYLLLHEFRKRMERERNVVLYIVELAYGDQEFMVTSSGNPRHLQLRTDTPLWHKENMINLGVRRLLPTDWRAFAWIDADLEFDSDTWATDTLKLLNGAFDIVQLFSHAVDMDESGGGMRVFNSAGYNVARNRPYCGSGPDQWHPGFAWAMTRRAFERVGGLYDQAILGSGDNLMMLSLIGAPLKGLNTASSDDYKSSVAEYGKRMQTLRFGYTPGVIRHYFHGSKKNRKYQERWMILVEHDYRPSEYCMYDEQGLITPTSSFPDALKHDIFQYFAQRNEDE